MQTPIDEIVALATGDKDHGVRECSLRLLIKLCQQGLLWLVFFEIQPSFKLFRGLSRKGQGYPSGFHAPA